MGKVNVKKKMSIFFDEIISPFINDAKCRFENRYYCKFFEIINNVN